MILSLHALSSGYRERLRNIIGTPITWLLAAHLRREGVREMFLRMRSLRQHRLVIAHEDAESVAIVPVLQCLALFSRVPELSVVGPEFRVARMTRGDALRSLGKLLMATGGCITSAVAAAVDLWWLRVRGPQPRHAFSGKDLLYLNANLWYGVKAGGSVGHIAGVVNGFAKAGWSVRYWSTSRSNNVHAHVRQNLLRTPTVHGLPPELNHYRFGRRVVDQVMGPGHGPTPVIYQRLSACNYSGAILSRRLHAPLVVEYNGSEVWAARHWGRPFVLEKLALAAERALLRAADIVVTVSSELAAQVAAAGVERSRILWYPNCVDPKVFDPARFSAEHIAAVRRRHRLSCNDVIVGFIGTFGMWHGVDVLANVIRKIIDAEAAWLDATRVKFMLVGDGRLMPKVREVLGPEATGTYVRLTGLVSQHDAPEYLAATDVLVSPHVPNPDGTPFFGSPTKLFEYMVMEKPIIASALDQIADVLQPSLHAANLPLMTPSAASREIAVLTRPGNEEDLRQGIRFLVEHPEWRARLGANARETALGRYTWDHHVGAILQALGTYGAS